MGGKAFKEKYEIQRVDKEVTQAVLDIVKRNLDYEYAAVGNTENVLLDLMKDTGDVDIIINADKGDLFDNLDSIKACVDKKKIANNILTVFSYGGKFYQVDFMTTPNIKLGKWLMKGNPSSSGVKGVMRNMLFCMLCRNLSDFASKEGVIKTKVSLSFPGSLRVVSSSTDEKVNVDETITDVRKIRSALRLSTNTRKFEFNTFESVVDYLLENNIYTCSTLKKGFVEYTEKSWVAKTMPNEREKAVEYIRRKEISDDS
jgi:hypothetical protein